MDVITIPHSQWGGSALFSRFIESPTGIYDSPWNEPGVLSRRAATIPPTALSPEDVAVLRRDLVRWDANEAALAAVERCAEPFLAVTTGQQPCLGGGPLYVLHKAITAVNLARQVERETGHPTVALFTMGSEDHDWDEMTRMRLPVPGAVGQWRGFALDPAARRPYHRMGTLSVGEELAKVLREIREVLGPGIVDEPPFAQSTLTDHFAYALYRALPKDIPLVICDGTGDWLKRRSAKVAAFFLEHPDEVRATLASRSEYLAAQGYHDQVRLDDRTTRLFYLEGEYRRKIVCGPDGEFTALGAEDGISSATLRGLAAIDPTRLSPDALARPLMLNAALPLVATVVGPGEAAYHAQNQPLYAMAGLRPHILWPRLSVSYLTPRALRQWQRLAPSARDLRENVPPPVEDSPEISNWHQKILATMDEISIILKRIDPDVQSVDPTLTPMLSALEGHLRHSLEKLDAKGGKVLQSKLDRTGRDFKELRELLFPCDEPQERVIPLVWAKVNRPGIEKLLDGWAENPIDYGSHGLVPLSDRTDDSKNVNGAENENPQG